MIVRAIKGRRVFRRAQCVVAVVLNFLATGQAHGILPRSGWESILTGKSIRHCCAFINGVGGETSLFHDVDDGSPVQNVSISTCSKSRDEVIKWRAPSFQETRARSDRPQRFRSYETSQDNGCVSYYGSNMQMIRGGGATPPPNVSADAPAANLPSRTSDGESDFRRVMIKCVKKAGRGGMPGAAAGLLQVVTLMWLRTVVNYQCRYGTSMFAAIAELNHQGGVWRFYRGICFALISNPLSRFGMAAANEGALALCDALPRAMPMAFTTWIASLFAGIWRIVLTPLDTCKTVLQVEGVKGFELLMAKLWKGEYACLYQGAMAASAATAVGYFPWFLVFNYLNRWIKVPAGAMSKVMRNASIGLVASISADVCSNSIRVMKTTKQAAAAYSDRITYREAASLVVEVDGWVGLLGRGLGTRILANGLQSMLFTVVWRYLHDKYINLAPLDNSIMSDKHE